MTGSSPDDSPRRQGSVAINNHVFARFSCLSSKKVGSSGSALKSSQANSRARGGDLKDLFALQNCFK